MKATRLFPVMLVGSILTAGAFAAAPSHSTQALTKDQVSQIQQDCAKANGGSMTSSGYRSCVKSREDAATAKANAK